MSRLKMWNSHESWEEAEKQWDEGSAQAAKEKSLKKLRVLPNIPGITEDTAKHLRWKGMWYMIRHDIGGVIRRHILKRPIRYMLRFIKSLFQKRPFHRDQDFYYYGLRSEKAFKQELAKENSLLVVGFSYCEKPHECPSGRFTDECIHDPKDLVCRQCYIGKCLNALPEGRTVPLIIPTIHYIGDKIFQTVHDNPGKEVLFLITSCELCLEMFADFGNMAGVKGVGVRLDGRICNTMQAFEKSEKGVKPGLTILLPETERRVLGLLKFHRGVETAREKAK